MPTTDVSARSGLFTATPAGPAPVPVPLDGVSISARIIGECAHVSIVQRYRNRERQPIEAVYVFPLDEGAAVCGFEAVVSGTHFVGEVKPREEAFRAYDDAMMAGHGAYLLDEERPDVFTASVGNLPPGGEASITLTYVTELAMDGAAVRFALPTVVAPRYAPAEDRVGVGRSTEATLNPPVAWTVPYGLEIALAVEMPGRITRLESPSHPLSIRLDGMRATVTLSQTQVALDRDVVVLVEAEGLGEPHAILERDTGGQSAAALVFRPSFDAAPAPADVVFVVDRSGSMDGSSMAEVRNALQLCLRSLVPGSRFDIVGFGDRIVSLFGESVAYDESSLARAAEHVEHLRADLGGTEVLPALQRVFDRRRSELPRQLIVLTDGEVTNTDAVIALVRQHAAHTRVFTFGIGASSSAHLVRGVARAGGGEAEFIYPGERIEAKVMRQFSRVMAPALTDVRVDWGGLTVRTSPAQLPAIYPGGRVVVYGWLTDPRPAVATLSGRRGASAVTFRLAIDPEAATEGRTLATLAARARIRELEEGAEYARGRSLQAGRRTQATVDEIVRLATAYGLVSRETSLVAIERREQPIEGDMALRRIPVALASGWGGLADGFFANTVIAKSRGSHACMALAPADAEDDDDHEPATEFRSLESALVVPRRPALLSRVPHLFRRPFAEAGPGDSTRPLDRVVSLQRADGSWELTAALADALGLKEAALARGAAQARGTVDDSRVWATLVALAWLARHAGGARDEWTMLAQKSERWLLTMTGDAGALADWRRAADAVF